MRVVRRSPAWFGTSPLRALCCASRLPVRLILLAVALVGVFTVIGAFVPSGEPAPSTTRSTMPSAIPQIHPYPSHVLAVRGGAGCHVPWQLCGPRHYRRDGDTVVFLTLGTILSLVERGSKYRASFLTVAASLSLVVANSAISCGALSDRRSGRFVLGHSLGNSVHRSLPPLGSRSPRRTFSRASRASAVSKTA